jgi:metallo-beta-lactamase family protein
MRIRFHGADRTVTGSCHLIEAAGLRVLLDFGLYQGPRDESSRINSLLPPDLKHVDAVILSHGHLDHCGRLPLLYRSGYRGPIYCTAATADVARVVLTDAAEIQQEDADYLNRRSTETRGSPITPLFTTADVQSVCRFFKPVPYDKTIDLSRKVRFTLHDAGHILGSAYVILEVDESQGTKKLLFTADVGRFNTPIIRDPVLPTVKVDAVITESTYGTVTHAPMDAVAPQLLTILQDAVKKKGRVILPSFAVGRTQTMLWYVQRFIQNKQLPELPIFVDSPMGTEISQITAKHAELFDDETRKAVCKTDDPATCDLFGLSRVTFAVTSEESRRINNVQGACVIIASSPTCEFGRVLHHLKHSIENPNDTVVFVGWTPPGTLGRKLQNLSPPSLSSNQQLTTSNSPPLRILDRLYTPRCRIQTLHGLSAHADGNELLRFLTPALSPQTTAFIVHGEEDRCDGFAARLTAQGIQTALAPAMFSAAVVGDAETGTDQTPTAPPIATDE